MGEEPEMYGRISTGSEKVETEKSKISKKNSNLIQLCHELVFGLALFQFLFLYLPYGFISLAGVNLPYTNIPFLLAFLMVMGLTGIILGIFTFMIYKAQKKSKIFEGTSISDKETIIASISSYLTALINFWLFFVNANGWQSDFIPVLIFFLGILASGLLAIIGLSCIYVSRKGVYSGLGVLISLGIVSALYLLTELEFEWILIGNGSIVLIIPILISYVKEHQHNLPLKNREEDLVPKIAWFDKGLERLTNRSAFDSLITLSIALSMSNLFATLIYIKVPDARFGIEALSFFIGAIIGVGIFLVLVKGKPLDLPILLVTGVSLVNLILNQSINRFANTILSLMISGFCMGVSLSLLIRHKEKRSGYPKLQDAPGGRIIELFYNLFFAAVIGLFSNLTLTLAALDPDQPQTPLPARLIFQGILLAFVIINLLTLNQGKTRMVKIDRGEIKETRGATSMEDFIRVKQEAADAKKKKKQKKSGGMVDMMAAVMGSGPPPDDKDDENTDDGSDN
ncbi:MAG: hypothetical protein ACFFCS_20880 [Candidatus Hodarchaeota archaeon]